MSFGKPRHQMHPGEMFLILLYRKKKSDLFNGLLNVTILHSELLLPMQYNSLYTEKDTEV